MHRLLLRLLKALNNMCITLLSISARMILLLIMMLTVTLAIIDSFLVAAILGKWWLPGL